MSTAMDDDILLFCIDAAVESIQHREEDVGRALKQEESARSAFEAASTAYEKKQEQRRHAESRLERANAMCQKLTAMMR